MKSIRKPYSANLKAKLRYLLSKVVHGRVGDGNIIRDFAGNIWKLDEKVDEEELKVQFVNFLKDISGLRGLPEADFITLATMELNNNSGYSESGWKSVSLNFDVQIPLLHDSFLRRGSRKSKPMLCFRRYGALLWDCGKTAHCLWKDARSIP